MKRTFRARLLAGFTAAAFLGSQFGPFMPHANAQTTQVIAPNLMIIFGNSFSMNRKLDDQTYPALSSYPRFNDDGYLGSATPGTDFPNPAWGDQSDSKLAVAKQALTSILNSPLSDNINLGFATFRTLFGLELATIKAKVNSTWPEVVPKDPSIYNDTNPNKEAYGRDPKNFSYVKWWRIWVPANGGRSAYLGRGAADEGKGVIDDSSVTYQSNQHNLPKTFRYKNVTTNDAWSPVFNRLQKIADQTNTRSSWDASSWLRSTSNVSGATGDLEGNQPRLTHRLCSTFYDSQNNLFKALYISDDERLFPDAYANQWNANTIQFVSLDYPLFDANGNMPPESWPAPCFDGVTKQVKTANGRITNQFRASWKADGTNAYFNYVPHFFAGTSNLRITPGKLTGWSGATTYTYSNESEWDGEYQASYPSGPATIDTIGLTQAEKNAITPYFLTNAYQKHMGVFLDLPDPARGYVDQRAVIRGFLRQEQMSAGGTEYDPQTKTIANNRGIAASLDRWNTRQSPIYDSLLSAKAYYHAYRAQDPYKSCRNNYVLLFYDGKEDAHYNPNGTAKDPATAAARLLAEEGVKTFVVILSSSPGDIAQAHAIAQAGGTNQAYVANDATSLLTAFTSVFSQLVGPTYRSAVAVPSKVEDLAAQIAVVPQYDEATKKATVLAYRMNGSDITDTLLWDANERMRANGAQDRRNRLYSRNSTNGSLVGFNNLSTSLFNTSNPTPATIKNYTIDPNYNNGAYLGGRASGSYIGRASHPSMQPRILKTTSGYIVLVPADDGFLYALDAATGNLRWGWMPFSFLDELKNYSSFWQQGVMNGGIEVVTLQNGTHIVAGTGRKGKLHYVLRLQANGDLDAVLFERDETDTGSNSSSPEFAAPLVWYNDSNKSSVTVAFVLTPDSLTGNSTLYWLTAQGSGTNVNLKNATLSGATITTNLEMVERASDLSAACSTGQRLLAAGKTSSSTRALFEIDVSSNNNNATVSNTYSYPTTPPEARPGVSSPRWVALTHPPLMSTTSGSDLYYAVVSGEDHILTLRASEGACPAGWSPRWVSYRTGAGKWDNATFDASVASNGPSLTKIQTLPSNATITARVKPVNDIVYAPVTEAVSGGAMMCGSEVAKLYLYRLRDGLFPMGVFTTSYYESGEKQTQQVEAENIVIGVGKAYEVQEIPGTGQVVATAEDTVGSAPGITITPPQSPVDTGRISWRELIRNE
ncbi:hypothetical protein JCM16106_07780 [Hydrogenophilus islandicus]